MVLGVLTKVMSQEMETKYINVIKEKIKLSITADDRIWCSTYKIPRYLLKKKK